MEEKLNQLLDLPGPRELRSVQLFDIVRPSVPNLPKRLDQSAVPEVCQDRNHICFEPQKAGQIK